MRIALINHSYNRINPEIGDLFSRVPGVLLTQFYLEHNKLFTLDGQHTTVHDIAINNDLYVLDPDIPYQVKENLHHYFDVFSVLPVYGETHELKNMPHDFLLPKSAELQSTHSDIERALVTLWTTITHPIRVKKSGEVSRAISSVHELRKIALPHVLKGEHLECVYQPKGRKLVCTLLRNARGKKVYTTPLFEKIEHSSGSKLTSSSLSHGEKEKIIKRLEELFSHYPTTPTLHVELTHTPKGIYLMHATPLQNVNSKAIPDTLHAVGMKPYEVLSSCLASLPAK